MLHSHQRVSTLLATVERELPRALVPADQLSHIRHVADVLPVFAIEFFGFECRLGAAAGGVDCAANLTPDGARMLAGRHPIKSPEQLRGGAWDTLGRFYQAWGDTGTSPYLDGPATWLEFDTSDLSLAPNLLFAYHPETVSRRPFTWLADEIMPMLFGRPISSGFRSNLQRCFEQAPRGVNNFQVGLMFSRQVAAARLCVFDLPPGGLLDYLDRVGWSGDRRQLRSHVEAFTPYADSVGLHLDIADVVLPNVGIEPNFSAGCWRRQPHREPRWHGLFDALSRDGLVTMEQCAELLDWPGYQRLDLDPSRRLVVLRGLSHLKVVLRPGQPPSAKAYFGIAQRPWPTAENDGDNSGRRVC